MCSCQKHKKISGMKFSMPNLKNVGGQVIGAAVGIAAADAADKYILKGMSPTIGAVAKIAIGVLGPGMLKMGKSQGIVDGAGDALLVLGLNDLKQTQFPNGIFGWDNNRPSLLAGGWPSYPYVGSVDNSDKTRKTM